jgi:RNA ligase (TIGR02306 family)
MRKLATVETISEIKVHTNADSLELATIRGWQCVVLKGQFKPGDMVVFFEIDSWIPTEIAPFLSKGHEPRVFEGVRGERLRTVKLRGELSQGLVLPVREFDGFYFVLPRGETVAHAGNMIFVKEGDDVTEALGIQKYEPPVPTHLAGNARGNFPSFIRKTDQERVQNCWGIVNLLNSHEHGGVDWIIEEKLDGSSCTVYVNFKRDVADGYYEIGVCSRNLELKLEGNDDNAYIRTVIRDGLLEALPKLNKSIAIQGELCGPGIQGNKLKLEQTELYVFDIWLIEQRRHATRLERMEIIFDLIAAGAKINQVPHLGTTRLPESQQACLLMAEGKSKINPKAEREGIVFKTANVIEGEVHSFKCISNKFLLREED